MIPKSAQKFHERIAKFPEFWSATRIEFVSVGQYALRKSYDVTEALGRVHGASRSEKVGARRRDHANFVRKSRERIAKFPEFRQLLRRALRKKKCVYSSVRCEEYLNVAAALGEVRSLFRSEKVRAWRRDHAKSAQKFRERIAELPTFRHAARRKKCVHSASVRCTTLATSLQLSVKSKSCSDPEKCASGDEITRNPRKNFAKEL